LRCGELVLFLGVVVGGGYALYDYARTSERLRVETITVDGALVLDEMDVITESGVTNADNLLFLDVNGVRDRVLAMPYVKSCRVERDFPNKVIVSIEERTAFATLLVENRSFLLDREGVVLEELEPNQLPVGPFITEVPDLGFIQLGAQLTQEPMSAALAVWAAFQTTDMAGDVTVSEIAAPHEDHIRMYCDELPFEIRWGRRDFVNEARRLDLIWRGTDHDPPCEEYLDLRFGNEPVCK